MNRYTCHFCQCPIRLGEQFFCDLELKRSHLDCNEVYDKLNDYTLKWSNINKFTSEMFIDKIEIGWLRNNHYTVYNHLIESDILNPI